MQLRNSNATNFDTEMLTQLALEKIEARIAKFASHPLNLQIRFSSHGHEERVTVHINAGRGLKLVASDASGNIFDAVDQVGRKLESQLRRRKGKFRYHQRLFNLSSLAFVQE